MSDRINVTVADGKYTFIMREDGSMTALRWGDEWPAFKNKDPDNLHLALAQEIVHLRVEVEKSKHEKPLTSAALAEALGAFWNASINEARNRDSSVAVDCAAVMSEGFAAVAAQLKGGAA